MLLWIKIRWIENRSAWMGSPLGLRPPSLLIHALK
ncbi:hypothetical protein GGE45_006054 [Rhizobium aethiopicum]|uniref:Uncharacterized protein n=1 Tax=Rhizobium aethiopicum TaxID=1138170 RepID=A0A7W6QEA1_9HYPH|nr:hypothetical protein [Rhizobium aethiopicum]MBB4583680.1 hypothetical protein [Rhizobium aethiopicum]